VFSAAWNGPDSYADKIGLVMILASLCMAFSPVMFAVWVSEVLGE